MTQHPLRVLIVDDSPGDADRIRLALERGGFVPDCLRVDSPEAVAHALSQGQTWDVVTCDAPMSALDAAQVVATVHGAMPAVPVVLVAGTYPHHLWHELGSGVVRRFVSKNQLQALAPTIRSLVHADPAPPPRLPFADVRPPANARFPYKS